MKMSRRARRMERHHVRSKKSIGINLTSLMDIFTILVFFLLVNSANVDVQPNTKSIQLPKSSAEQAPKLTLTIMVNDTDLLVQGRPIASVAELLNSQDNIIETLKQELEYQASRSPLPADDERGRDITILGDKEIPYRLLKKIMITCNSANYNNISLAVTKKGN